MEDIEKIIDKFDLDSGIDVHGLKAGTIVFAKTKNSLYKLTKTDVYNQVYVEGGKYFPEPKLAYFAGSTFGGSMIKIGWIGFMMYMEMYIPDLNKKIKTTGVRSAKIVGNNWEYDMEWENKKEE